MNQKHGVVEEIHQQARRNYSRRKVEVKGLGETYQADLVEMIPYADENKGYKYLLNVIDIFSKYAYSVPLKSKTGVEVSSAMESILKKKSPRNLHVDMGKEFYNKHFENLMKRYKINMYSTYTGLKASICERFNRTLKNFMWKKFSLQGNYKWLSILPELIDSYNNRVHRSIGMKPKDVTEENESVILKRLNQIKTTLQTPKFKVGDKVRVSKLKHIFEKKYTPNWSTEIFTITRIVKTKPVTYHLKDYQDQPVVGGFYEEELKKTKFPDVYLIEKVIKKQGDRLFVKWLGFDNSHNSWINKNDL